MEFHIIARFHACAGNEDALEDALYEVHGPTAAEPGCLYHHVFRSIRDEKLFYVHSRWKDEAAFDAHVVLPHTVRFHKRVAPLLDHPLDVVRVERIEEDLSSHVT